MTAGGRGAYGKLHRRELSEVCGRVTAGQALVYVALVTFRNAKTGETPPVAASSVAKACGCSVRQVHKAVNALVNAGVLGKEHLEGEVLPRYRFPLSEKG